MLIYGICYGVSMLFAAGACYSMSGVSLFAAAAYLYLYDYLKSGDPLHLRALFSLFWVGGQGLSCLKLSRLQTEWELMTWACFFAATAGVWLSFAAVERRNRQNPLSAREETNVRGLSHYGNGIYLALVLLTMVSFVSFLFEASFLGYIPFFLRGVPHAYSYFHVSGVHYFTVSCVLVPSMAVMLYFCDKEDGRGFLRWLCRRMLAGPAVLLALTVPILCVSRFQLVFAVVLAVLTFMLVSGRKRLWYLVLAGLFLLPLYVVLTIARSHDVAYLNGIFEMKRADTPIFITQPYMYIANNYDNFNCLVRELPRHTLGVKGLFPLWALTGLKFIKPELAAYPIFTTKEELTTVTLFYDAYYDFGIIGVFAFACLLGTAAAWLLERQRHGRSPVWTLFYAQAALYFMLSFFTTWYSNPTTWFYFAVTAAFAVLTEFMKNIKYGKEN
ncbi:MAG: oligosaccharide repeat unit polymerase [Lachnospiraceae bacterium]|nr:oligosaccharide repeat unit polymerase [Lachnospiraceae bacterium]